MSKPFVQPGLETITNNFLKSIDGATLNRAEVIDRETIRITYYLEGKLKAKLIDFKINK